MRKIFATILFLVMSGLVFGAVGDRTKLTAYLDPFDTNGNPITIDFVNMYCGTTSGTYPNKYIVAPIGDKASLPLAQLPDGTYYCRAKQESNGIEGAYSVERGPFKVVAGISPQDGVPVALPSSKLVLE